MLDAKTVKSIWNAGAAKQKECSRRNLYYRGKQTVPELLSPRIDGRIKTISKTNFVKYVAGMYAGFLTSSAVNYTLQTPEQDKTALQEHYATYTVNNLHAADTEHLINSLLFGYSVEVHSFEDGAIRVQVSEPTNWSFVHDERGRIAIAVYKAVLPAFSLYQGELLEKEKHLFYVYDAATIETYEELDGGIQHLSTVAHSYGRLPVVVFRVTKNHDTFFSDSFLAQCDLYDVISSAMVDDVKYSIDALLAVKGVNWQPLLDKDKNGVSVIQKLKDIGLFPLPENASAEFLSRDVDTEKFRFALRVIRENIHRMANVPDLVDRVNGDGAITSISGIALRLLFQGMEQQGAEFVKYFEEGLRDRVDLFNRVWAILGKPRLEGFAVRITKNIPVNEIEIMQYIGNLDGLVSTKDQLSLLPFISNPELAFYNLQEEQKQKVAPTAVENAA